MERVEGRDEIGPWVIGGDDVPDAPRNSAPPPPPPRRQQPPSGLRTLGCLSPFLLILYLLFRLTNPSDWGEVTVRSIPEDAHGAFVIAESSGVAEALKVYHSKVLPFASWVEPFGRNSVTGSWDPMDLAWRDADRYGVLSHGRDGSWKLWWLGPGDVRKPWIFRHLGGGAAEFRVPDPTRAEVPTREFVDFLGLPPR